MKKLFTLLLTACGYVVMAQPCSPNTNSILFNGTSTNVSTTTGTALNFTNEVSVEALIKATQWKTNNFEGSIVCKHGWSSGEAGYVIRAGNNGQLSFNIGYRDTFGVVQSWRTLLSPTGVMSLNTWYHVAGTYDGEQLRIYINGNFIDSLIAFGTIVASPNYNLKIGGLSDAQALNRYWAGYIDEVRVWNRALPQSEIQARMSQHINPALQTGLAAYYRFNDGSGTIATELANNYTGTLNSGVWSTDVPFTNSAPAVNITPPGPVNICGPGQVTLTANSSNVSYVWNTTDTTAAITVNISGTYTVTVTNSAGCTASQSATVNFNSIPTVSLSLTQDTVCVNAPAFPLTGGSPSGGVYSGTGVSANLFSPLIAGAGTHTIYYTYTDANNCTNNDSAQIFVDLCLGISMNAAGNYLIISPNPVTNELILRNDGGGIRNLEIWNGFGEKVYTATMNTAIRELTVDVNKLRSGIYYLKAKTEAGEKAVKFVKL